MTYHILGRNEAIVAVGDEKIEPVGIISITAPGEKPPALFTSWLRCPVLHLRFDDVPCTVPNQSYTAAVREDVERALAWEAPAGDVIVHCAAGISRSSAIVLARLANHPQIAARDANIFVGMLAEHVKDTARARHREGTTIYPNVRIVWLADQILGYDGHLLAAVQRGFAMRGVWASLRETPPANWPGSPE